MDVLLDRKTHNQIQQVLWTLNKKQHVALVWFFWLVWGCSRVAKPAETPDLMYLKPHEHESNVKHECFPENFLIAKNAKKCNSLKQPPKIQGNVPSKRNHRLESGWFWSCTWVPSKAPWRHRPTSTVVNVHWFSETTRCLGVWLVFWDLVSHFRLRLWQFLLSIFA